VTLSLQNTLVCFQTRKPLLLKRCGGCHYTAQKVQESGHRVIVLKPKDVKPYAKSRQKNDLNDALAICKSSLDPHLMHVHAKSREQQEVAYLHKARQNAIQHRIQRSNSILTSLQEFGYGVPCGKSAFAKRWEDDVREAFDKRFIPESVFEHMLFDCEEIHPLMRREKGLDKALVEKTRPLRKQDFLKPFRA
jgi:transposase